MLSKRALLVAVVAVAAFACLSACATTGGKGESANLKARDFYPLAVGNTWEYRVSPTPPGAPPTGEVKILSKDEHGFFIDNQKGHVAPRTDGVFDGDRFLLQEPLEEGHEWIAVPKNQPKDQPSVVEKYKITAVGTQATVPAGNFDGCVEVEAVQKDRGASVKMTWTYAPGVGLVKAVQVVTPDKKPPITTMTMELVRFEVKPAT
jgi:hypothetical protein